MDINTLRDQIDALDDELMQLLEERFTIVEMIGQIKKREKHGVLDVSREESILNKAKEYSHNQAISMIFKTLLSESKSLQRKL